MTTRLAFSRQPDHPRRQTSIPFPIIRPTDCPFEKKSFKISKTAFSTTSHAKSSSVTKCFKGNQISGNSASLAMALALGMQYRDPDERSPSKDIPEIHPDRGRKLGIARVAANRNRVEPQATNQGGRHAGPEPQDE